MTRTGKTAIIELRGPLLRGDSRVRIALVGMPGCGASTLFRAVESTSAHRGALAGTHSTWRACEVDVGLD